MADEPNPSSTDATPTTTETTTALGVGLATAKAPTSDAPPAATEAIVKPPELVGAPEKYSDWKLPDGYTLDAGVSESGGKLFKELNLTQDQAQKLVDFYSEHSIKTSKENSDFWDKTKADWREGLKNDPILGKLVGSDGNFGPDSPLIRTVNQALDGLQNPKLVSAFKEAMELTGAGDNPAFVQVLHALASKVTEGTTYVRGEPSAAASRRPTAAASMYPNLPSGG